MGSSLSIVVPTRERATYLRHCLNTCLQSKLRDLEVLVIDNASADSTADVVKSYEDSRLRYIRSEQRLSMRDNFERGIDLARGDILLTIGDDDGVLSDGIEEAMRLFDLLAVDAVSAARVHYRWPDISAVGRNTALVPRRSGLRLANSRVELRSLLRHGDYHKLPCIYHQFVRRKIIDKVRARQGRLILSSQVDMYSTIAMSMEDIPFAYSECPFVINGSSRRSNGVSHFSGDDATEKQLWKREDDVGFLAGFAGSLTIDALIVESALRYAKANHMNVSDIFDSGDIARVLNTEFQVRRRAGWSEAESRLPFVTAGIGEGEVNAAGFRLRRLSHLAGNFWNFYPVMLDGKGVDNVHDCANYVGRLIASRELSFTHRPMEQIMMALRYVPSLVKRE